MQFSTIEIVEYRPHWIVEFQRIGATLRKGLGASALRIDHIGSTSIPGLCAKDVIDVQVTVNELERDLVSKISRLGYLAPPGVWSDHHPPEATGQEEDWAKLFFEQPNAERRINLHVRVMGRPNQRYALLVRDYLRVHRAEAVAYGQLKRRLALAVNDVDDYSDIKDPVVDLIYLAATRWAMQTMWQPQSSDA